MIMALDLGDARTGVAFSDVAELLAGQAYSITEYNKEKLLETLCRLAEERRPRRIVAGLPINMDGSEGPRAHAARAFEAACGVETDLWDERMTSVMANRILSQAGKKRGKQRRQVDAVAASLILQSYLDSGRAARPIQR